ncbi:MAG: hypothetical protein SNF33_05825 [Candidatus Algichlamydia australiensis]|nr:hypothetical protein [Chlamydiales bacterium]
MKIDYSKVGHSFPLSVQLSLNKDKIFAASATIVYVSLLIFIGQKAYAYGRAVERRKFKEKHKKIDSDNNILQKKLCENSELYKTYSVLRKSNIDKINELYKFLGSLRRSSIPKELKPEFKQIRKDLGSCFATWREIFASQRERLKIDREIGSVSVDKAGIKIVDETNECTNSAIVALQALAIRTHDLEKRIARFNTISSGGGGK